MSATNQHHESASAGALVAAGSRDVADDVPSYDGAVSHAHDVDEVGSPPVAPRTSVFGLLLFLLVAGGAVAGAYYVGWMPRQKQAQTLERSTQAAAAALPRVRVVAPRPMPATDVVLLPGDLRALEESAVFPRADGYLRKRYVDLGDRVTAGKLLAEIDVPEIDAQVEQAKATLAESQAALDSAIATARLNETTVTRSRRLIETNAIPQQDLDEAEAAVVVANARVKLAEATIKVNNANLRRVTELQSFAKIYAPFDGTVVERTVENGQLITAGNSSTQALFRIAKTNPLRVFVDVPQDYAANVRQGLEATLVVRNMPDRKFTGKVTRTAGAIDLQTRTLRTEILVPNDDGALLPGAYIQVSMQVTRENPPLLIPASSLVFNSDGTRVAVVDDKEQVHFREVTVERDFGPDIGISAGLEPNDLVVANPGDRLSEGATVEIDGGRPAPLNTSSQAAE